MFEDDQKQRACICINSIPQAVRAQYTVTANHYPHGRRIAGSAPQTPTAQIGWLWAAILVDSGAGGKSSDAQTG